MKKLLLIVLALIFLGGCVSKLALIDKTEIITTNIDPYEVIENWTYCSISGISPYIKGYINVGKTEAVLVMWVDRLPPDFTTRCKPFIIKFCHKDGDVITFWVVEEETNPECRKFVRDNDVSTSGREFVAEVFDQIFTKI